jgi:hypothetical protein
MPEITRTEKTFTYNIPDEYLHQTNDLGKTATWTYTGPDKMWIFVDNETNKILSRFHYTERDNGAEVPTPEGMTKILVDANEDPLLASLLHNEVDYFSLGRHETTLPDGSVYWHTDPLPPDHAYELIDIEYDTETNKLKKPYPWKKPHITWEELIDVRNNMLRLSDSKYRVASPEELPEWEEYRQKLRDLTTTFNGIDPWMIPFPVEPGSSTHLNAPTVSPDIPNSGVN